MKNAELIFIAILFLVVEGCIQSDSTQIDKEIHAIENGLQKAVISNIDSLTTFSILDRMKYYKVPGVSICIVKNGAIRWSKGYGLANPIDSVKATTNTLFQAASISKAIAASAALKLVEKGLLDLDEDVNRYLKGWKIQDNEFTAENKVTMRGLLTHSAGITVSGFPGYSQSDTLPTLEQILNGRGNSPRVYVSSIPGSGWNYSGGGYTIAQKVIEDISETSLEEYMQKHIFKPLNMNNTTFEYLNPEKHLYKASAAFDSEGELFEGFWYNYPEKAAGGLWSTPEDLAKYCIEIQQILAGKQNGILKKETVDAMLTKHTNEDWGLGPSLVGNGDSLRFEHSGHGRGFVTDMNAFAFMGNAVVLFSNGDGASLLNDEILRSVSNYYGWNMISSKEVEVVKVKPTQLDTLVGNYTFDPTVNEPLFDITINGNSLVLNAGERGTFEFVPLKNSKFMDLATGNEIVFNLSSDPVELIWNGEDKFFKIE